MYEIFITLLVLGCVLMFINLAYATMQKSSRMQVYIVMALVSIILMFAGYYIELKATSLEMALMGTVVAYFGKPFILFFGFMVICAFYEFEVRKIFQCLCYAVGGLIFLAVFTNPYTHLYYSSYSFELNDDGHMLLMMENGPLYLLHGGSMVVYYVGCTIVSIVGYLRNRNNQSAKFSVYLVLMVLFSLLGYVVYLTGWSQGYDTTIFGAMAGIICLTILFYRHRLFDAVSIAKDSALESSITGIIVIDSNNRIAYANQTGNLFLSNCFSIEKLSEQTVSEKNYQINDCVYRVSRKEIENEGRYVCTSFEVNDVTASANYQAILEKEVKERTEKIEAIQRRSIASLASVVEARSLETGQHIIRTSEYSRMIAAALKEQGKYAELFTDDYIRLLADVTPLHDIGKVSVPDSILLKPGRLNEEEFREIKKHAEMGAEIIEKAMRGVEDDRYVDLASTIALYHHERWDGTGYPKGLKGTEIPIEARIMAVADCFDALSSSRCYKKAFSIEESISILKEESGTHFDPEVTEAFLIAFRKQQALVSLVQ